LRLGRGAFIDVDQDAVQFGELGQFHTASLPSMPAYKPQMVEGTTSETSDILQNGLCWVSGGRGRA
jgi:hypothetical protein